VADYFEEQGLDVVARLSLPGPLSPSLVKVLELGTVGTVAAVFAFAQYQAMLDWRLGPGSRRPVVAGRRPGLGDDDLKIRRLWPAAFRRGRETAAT
jgi:hypothetical protein